MKSVYCAYDLGL